jgi:hypothetical protein
MLLSGYISAELGAHFSRELRVRKVIGMKGINQKMEIALIPNLSLKQFPSFLLFTGSSRFSRPVRNLSCEAVEWIGSFEQVYLNVAVTPAEIKPHLHTHLEISALNILSVNAAVTPFSDFNQSPRNMYQCQMGKQTMATPCHSLPFRCDNKLYKIQTPQIPNVMTESHTNYCMNDFPQGTNAIIAVISYTGYDMEDAMILNKGSFERGFAHASVYTTAIYDLKEIRGDTSTPVIQAYVIASYEAASADEVSVQEGEMVSIVDKSFGISPTCRVMTFATRKFGSVPCHCLQIIRPGVRSVAKRDVANAMGETILVKGDVVDVIRDISPLEQEVFIPRSGVTIPVRIGLLDPVVVSKGNSKYFDNRVRGTNSPFEKRLDTDGLPFIGSLLEEGDPFYCYYDEESAGHSVMKYKKAEPSRVDQVTFLG